ncbi:MAG: hypothetical protein WAL84_12475 [Candidatus Dormiibacterota bacterium]
MGGVTGADVIYRAILDAGINTVFGYPGSAIMLLNRLQPEIKMTI